MKNIEKILDIKVNVSSFNEILNNIEQTINQDKKITITYLTPHLANYCYTHLDSKNIINQFDIVIPDGVGIVIASKLNKGHITKRMPLQDHLSALWDFLIAKNMLVYLLGAKPEIINKTVKALKENKAALNIAGFHHGYFDFKDNSIIEKINKVKPDMLFVGMGQPYQEIWIHEYKDLLKTNVIWACGSCFDIVSNSIRRAPEWILKNNMEWVYRLYKEPKRLWKRYLIGNPLFVFRILKNRLSQIFQ